MECSVYDWVCHECPGGYSLSWPIRGGSAQKGCPIQAPGIWEGKDFTEFEVSNQVIGSCWSISRVEKSLFPYVKGAKRANRRNMIVKKSEKISFTTPSNINVIVLKLCWRGQQRRVHLLVCHPIITFLSDRLWNNNRIKDILVHAKTPISWKNLSFIPIYWKQWFQEIKIQIYFFHVSAVITGVCAC